MDSGVDHLYFHQIGDDQEAFCDAWRSWRNASHEPND